MTCEAQAATVSQALTRQNLAQHNAALPMRPIVAALYPASARPDAPTPRMEGRNLWHWLGDNMPDQIPTDATTERRAEVLKKRREAFELALPEIWLVIKVTASYKEGQPEFDAARAEMAMMKRVLTPEDLQVILRLNAFANAQGDTSGCAREPAEAKE